MFAPFIIWLFSFYHFFLFCSFRAFQNYFPTIHSIGNLVLTVLYFVFAFACFVSPSILVRFKSQNLFPIASLGYIIFMFSGAISIDWLMFVGGITCGLGASIHWVGLGAFITENTLASRRGLATGVVATFYGISDITGNLMAGILFSKMSNANVQLILAFIGCCGFIFALLVYKFTPPPICEEQVEESSMSFTQVNTFNMSRKARCFIVYFIWDGLLRAWAIAAVNPLIDEESVIGFANSVNGVTFTIFSIVTGKTFDVFENKMIVPQSAIFVTTLLFALTPLTSKASYMPYVLGGLHGISRCLVETSITPLISATFPKEKEVAFGSYKFNQSISTSVLFLIATFVDANVLSFIGVLISIMASAALFWHSKGVPPAQVQSGKVDGENENAI